MLGEVSDRQVLTARGMGAGAYESMHVANIRPVVTDTLTIVEAITAYLDGSLADHTEKLH
jgi:predicted Fe-Mo cluster-binding NifX family protein